MIHHLLLLAASLSLGASAPRPRPTQGQDPPPAPPILPAEEPALRASDGQPAAPGRVPADTAPEALARWQRALAAIGAGPAGERPPIAGFDLELDVTHRREGGSNKTLAGFRYLEDPRGPFLRAFLERRNLAVLRGPAGDFLVDGEEVQSLAGREAAQDRRQLEEYLSICRNFLSLTRPDQVRLVRLEARELAPPGEGDAGADVRFTGDPELVVRLARAEDARLARTLEWLYVESPDFRLAQSSARAGTEVPRALLGLERASGQVRLAFLAEGGSGPLVAPRSLCVEVRSYRELEGGWRVPQWLLVRPVDLQSALPRFARLEDTELWLKQESVINPPLTPRDFLPR